MFRSLVEDDSIRGENKTSPVNSVCGVERREGWWSRKEKKEGGDYRRLLSRIRLVIIVISTVRNAREYARAHRMRETREERRGKRGKEGEGEKKKKKEK